MPISGEMGRSHHGLGYAKNYFYSMQGRAHGRVSIWVSGQNCVRACDVRGLSGDGLWSVVMCVDPWS